MKLNKLTGSLSWYFLDNVKIDAKFPKVPVTSWNEETSKVHGWDIIKALKVCNDRAVHEVILASDLSMSALGKENNKIILQIVMKKVVNQRNDSVASEKWLLIK